MGILKDFINPIPPSPDVDFSEIPFLENAGPSSIEWAFVIRKEQDVAEVTDLLLRNSHRYGLLWIEDRLDFEKAYPRTWGPNSPGSRYHCYKDPEFYAAAKLAGDQDWIEKMAGMAFSVAQTNLAEVWQDCIDQGIFKKPHIKSGEITHETVAQNVLYGRLTPAVTVKAIAEAMSLDIPEFEVDVSELKYTIEPWR